MSCVSVVRYKTANINDKPTTPSNVKWIDSLNIVANNDIFNKKRYENVVYLTMNLHFIL